MSPLFIMFLLSVKHFVGSLYFQPVLNQEHGSTLSRRSILVCSALHGIITAIILIVYTPYWWLFAALDFMGHYLVNHWKIMFHTNNDKLDESSALFRAETHAEQLICNINYIAISALSVLLAW